MNLRTLILETKRHLEVTLELRAMTQPVRWRGDQSGIPEHIWVIATDAAFGEYVNTEDSIRMLEKYVEVYYRRFPGEEL